MMVSELLWVGSGPEESHKVATAQEAVAFIEKGIPAVVPTTDVAHEALLIMGASNEWANYVTGRALRYDIEPDLC